MHVVCNVCLCAHTIQHCAVYETVEVGGVVNLRLVGAACTGSVGRSLACCCNHQRQLLARQRARGEACFLHLIGGGAIVICACHCALEC
jgi:hypothetical protein